MLPLVGRPSGRATHPPQNDDQPSHRVGDDAIPSSGEDSTQQRQRRLVWLPSSTVPSLWTRTRRRRNQNNNNDQVPHNSQPPQRQTGPRPRFRNRTALGRTVSPSSLAQPSSDHRDSVVMIPPSNAGAWSTAATPPSTTSSAAVWTAEAVASLPPPGVSGPSQVTFSPPPPRRRRRRQDLKQPTTGDPHPTNGVGNSHQDETYDTNLHDQHGPSSSSPLFLAFVSAPGTVIRTAKPPPSMFRPLTTGLYPSPPGGTSAKNSGRAASSSGAAVQHSQTNLHPDIYGTSSSQPPSEPHPQTSSSHATTTTPPFFFMPSSASTTASQPTARTNRNVSAKPLSSISERVLMCLDVTSTVASPTGSFNEPQHTHLQPHPLLRLGGASSVTTKTAATVSNQHNNNKRRLLESAASFASSSSSCSSLGYGNKATTTVSKKKPTSKEHQKHEAQASRNHSSSSISLTSSSQPVTQFSWTWCWPSTGVLDPFLDNNDDDELPFLRVLIPWRGNLFVQDGVSFTSHLGSSDGSRRRQRPTVHSKNRKDQDDNDMTHDEPRCIYNALSSSNSLSSPCIDPQLSPDGSMVAWAANGELFVQSCGDSYLAEKQDSVGSRAKRSGNSSPRDASSSESSPTPIQITFGAVQTTELCISHGIAEFVAQEEMDRYRGFWWHPQSTGILFVRVDESHVPPFRILHHHDATTTGQSSSSAQSTTTASESPLSPGHQPSQSQPPLSSSAIPYEDHRYPFAGKMNPKVQLAYVEIDRQSILSPHTVQPSTDPSTSTHPTNRATNCNTKTKTVPNTTTTPPYQSSSASSESSATDSCAMMMMDDDEDDDRAEQISTMSSSSSSPPRRQGNAETIAMESSPPPSNGGSVSPTHHHSPSNTRSNGSGTFAAQDIAREKWTECTWLDAPQEASEYLARIRWLPNGSAVAQWQNRAQNLSILVLMELPSATTPPSSSSVRRRNKRSSQVLLMEQSEEWINLHNMFHVLPRAVHPDECIVTSTAGTAHSDKVHNVQIPSLPNPLPEGSFSFLFASERTGYQHLYLYTYCPGITSAGRLGNHDHSNYYHSQQQPQPQFQQAAIPLRTVSAGKWMVESIAGVDMDQDVVYVTGTYDSVLERHLYALPLLNRRLVVQPSLAATTTSTALDGSCDVDHSDPNHHSLLLNHTATKGVRRGLSKVMHVLSGKGNLGRSNSNSGNHRTTYTNRVLQEAIWASMRPVRLTLEAGMHSIVMDDLCRLFVDTSSDMDRPTSSRIYQLPPKQGDFWTTFLQRQTEPVELQLVYTLYDALKEDNSVSSAAAGSIAVGGTAAAALPSPLHGFPSGGARLLASLPPPELISFPCSDGIETLHAALYRPNPRIYGPGPYPLVCAVYGGPHVQRVNRSWSQCADMRAQRLRSMGFCVIKCDNRGSSRRGLEFEAAIRRRLGRLEVLDQVAAARQLILRGLVDASRIGVYGWSYGGYLAAMCLSRAPDVFCCAVAGAPVTSWDGYDTHYTERYMGHPQDNVIGYRESAVLDHVPNIKGKLLLVHGLLDENVHFRHTTRLINKLVACGKEYEVLLFPEERHSPRRLRDRIYMEQRISDFFVRNLLMSPGSSPAGTASHSRMIRSAALDPPSASGTGNAAGMMRTLGHL